MPTQPSAMIVARAAAILTIAAGAALLMATPTLNFDDLNYAAFIEALSPSQLPGVAWRFFFNLDLGNVQTRTYGLARVFQLVTFSLLGRSPQATYATLIAIHFGAACLVYRYALRASGDRVVALFCAIAWAGSPAALPMVKTEHYYLYLVAPFTVLIGWLLVATGKQGRYWNVISPALLTSSWLLGESVVPALALSGTVLVLASWRMDRPRSMRIAAHLLIAATLLLLYLTYQRMGIKDLSLGDRFRLVSDISGHAILNRVFTYLQAVLNAARCIVGLSFYDEDYGAIRTGFGAIDLPASWIVIVILGVIFCGATARARSSETPLRPVLAWAFAAMTLGSVFLYLLVAVVTTSSIGPRYSFAFMILAPIAMTTVISGYSRSLARSFCATTCALLLGLYIVSFSRAEILVSRKNRAELANLIRDREITGKSVIVLEHDGWIPPTSGMVDGTYPGLGSQLWTALPDPMLAAWSADLALRQYAGVRIALFCITEPDGRARGVMQTESWIFDIQSAYAVGLDALQGSIIPKPLHCRSASE
jgi:hypothetical protein